MAKKKIVHGFGTITSVSGSGKDYSAEIAEIKKDLAEVKSKKYFYEMIDSVLEQGDYIQFTKNKDNYTIKISKSDNPIPEEPSSGIYSYDSELNDWRIYDQSTIFSSSMTTKIKYTLQNSGESKTIAKTQFNEKIKISADVQKQDYFLAYCSAFNQSIDLSQTNWTETGEMFMYQCVKFNSSIKFNNLIQIIDKSFMTDCSVFNQNLENLFTNNLITIGEMFMNNCKAFDQAIDLTICEQLQNVGNEFMYNCKNYQQTLSINETIFAKFQTSQDSKTFSTAAETDLVYTNGFKISGVTKDNVNTKFPDSNSNPFRKTVIVQ